MDGALDILAEATKACTRCGAEKPLGDFPFRSKVMGTRHARCKPCMREVTRPYAHTEARRRRHREYHQENAETRNARRRQWHADHPMGRRITWLARYGLTLEDYDELLLAQNGLCAICGLEPNYRGLFVDHCHSTGRVRGLLCTRCNVALGMLEDDPERMLAAACYLEDSRALATTDPLKGTLCA